MAVRFVRLVFNVVMPNDGYFVDEIHLYLPLRRCWQQVAYL